MQEYNYFIFDRRYEYEYRLRLERVSRHRQREYWVTGPKRRGGGQVAKSRSGVFTILYGPPLVSVGQGASASIHSTDTVIISNTTLFSSENKWNPDGYIN